MTARHGSPALDSGATEPASRILPATTPHRPPAGKTRRLRGIVLTGALLAAVLLAGFLMFAVTSTRQPTGGTPPADGIVVLTGADRRIERGLQLLRDGQGRRLLISGVNRLNSPADVLAHAGGHLATCCVDRVDFGYDALDTIGNAHEARAWAARHGFRRLIVVTSSYHMPRSLAEISMTMPGIELVPHAVVPKSMRERPWWVSASAARVLIVEYLKLLPSYGRWLLYRALRLGSPSRPASVPAL